MSSRPKDHAYSHSENRSKLCSLCLKKKSGMRVVNETLQKHIQKIAVYNPDDDRIPNSICAPCKIGVYRNVKAGGKEIAFPDYSSFSHPLKSPRLNADRLCDSTLCTMARKSGKDKSPPKNKDSVKKICLKCGSEIAREHPTIVPLSQERGKKFGIIIPARRKGARTEQKTIRADQVSKIQTDSNLSTNTMKSITSALRVATGNRKLFEPHLGQKLSSINRSLADHYEIRKANFVHKVGDKVTFMEKIFVLCKDLRKFSDHIKALRGCETAHLEISIDGGGGSLKIHLTMQSDVTVVHSENSEIASGSRQKYSEGIAAKRFKESGVKRLFILGLVAGAQENYENVRLLWPLLNINTMEYTIATDLKLANLLAAKSFMSCVHQPLFTGEDETEVIARIPPPELHIMLGAFDTLYKNMLLMFPGESIQWAKDCHVMRQVTHGGEPAFAGNACRKLLNNVGLLRRNI
ncbi:hypothetical protein QAD02_003540 [Eretmocerus hayati]|uniref:Uncharacterized protein n=1 Tax=Eretmocerus hayati TaxID=131215 RepID=A0ACC2NNU4_9HYME|nr:hypothetical protein QAD02_003540 [Eretmocerus hayati]